MFSIGGVSALKQHAFFEFLDWNALERLQVTPPFNFLASTTVPGSAASTKVAAAEVSDGFSLQFFDAEFTNQQLSLSMLEDTLVSPSGGTPMRRSGTASRDEGNNTLGINIDLALFLVPIALVNLILCANFAETLFRTNVNLRSVLFFCFFVSFIFDIQVLRKTRRTLSAISTI